MREILFRGKRLDNGKWVEGAFCPNDCDDPFGPMVYKPSIIKLGDPCDGFWFAVDPETVGQYTGMTDKNGKRIFEGDIVRIERAEWGFDGMSTNYRTEQGVIAYDDWGMVGLVVDKYENRPVWSDFFHVCGLTDRVHDWSFEVIGNIHDNPELIADA